MACSFWGLGFAWLWVFLPSAHSFTLFCSLATISCHTALLFLLWYYLTQTCKASLGLLLILLPMTPYDHWAFYYIACGLLCSIYFLLASLAHLLSLGILGHFSNSAFPWAITNSFGLPRPNFFILHPWGSWTFHQPLSFFTCITSGLLWSILTFLHHMLPMGLLLLSLQAPLGPFASLSSICLFYGPMIHYSCHLGIFFFFH